MGQSELEPPAVTVRKILSASRAQVGSWAAVAAVASMGTGQTHSPRSASAWGNGRDRPYAEVIVALLRALPPDVREALLDGSYVEESETSASSGRLESLESEVAQLRSAVALVMALLREFNARAGLEVFEQRPGLNEAVAQLDPPMVALLRQMGLISA